MKKFNLNKPLNVSIVNKFIESKDKNTRIIEFVLFKEDDGIPPHIHPYGEGCAYILEGNLSYSIDFDESILVKERELVVGRRNLIHGYKNFASNPVHFIVFATPENNITVYPKKGEFKQEVLPVEKRKYDCLNQDFIINSSFTTYSTLSINGKHTEELEKGIFKAFLDIEDKIIYIFDNEFVSIATTRTKKFLRFSEINYN